MVNWKIKRYPKNSHFYQPSIKQHLQHKYTSISVEVQNKILKLSSLIPLQRKYKFDKFYINFLKISFYTIEINIGISQECGYSDQLVSSWYR